jgi:phosphoribosylglycinamide formyltransferase-1
MVAIHKAIERGDLTARLAHVISNNAGAAGLDYAAKHGIATSVLDHRKFANRDEFDRELQSLVEQHCPSLVLLAGFMRRLGAAFTHHFEGSLLNIHPSLLPRHPGLHTHEHALKSKDHWHGCSVHFVSPVLDGGPLIARSNVQVIETDTANTLAARVLVREHILYWQVAQWVLCGRIKWRDGHVEYCGKRLIYPLTL